VNKIKLFCFPYAGGSANVYVRWKKYLHPEIELQPVELAGRGKRIHSPLYRDVNEATEDVYDRIKKDIAHSSYALFGHSLGGTIAYELAQKIAHTNYRQPLHVFISGHGAPHIERPDEKKYHLMRDDQFKKELLELGGTPPEFFESPELMAFFLPVLKNDFRIAETQVCKKEIRPLDTDITIFLGKEDDMVAEESDGWKHHTKGICSIHYFEGGHFFLHNESQRLAERISATLRKDQFQTHDNLLIN
jgi:medium-chain acyl-[acyl-carrier-protein] hydrolase